MIVRALICDNNENHRTPTEQAVLHLVNAATFHPLPSGGVRLACVLPAHGEIHMERGRPTQREMTSDHNTCENT